MERMLFGTALRRALEGGLSGVALVDREGTTVDLAGEITEDEAGPLATFVMFQLKAPDLAERLFAGDILTLELDGRAVVLGIAQKQLFVVAVMPIGTPGGAQRVAELRTSVAATLASAARERVLETIPPAGTGSGGTGGAGPAALPVVEWGITVRRERGKA